MPPVLFGLKASLVTPQFQPGVCSEAAVEMLALISELKVWLALGWRCSSGADCGFRSAGSGRVEAAVRLSSVLSRLGSDQSGKGQHRLQY